MNGFTFNATKARVPEQGSPPESFLAELLGWAKSAPDAIFAANAEPRDICGPLLRRFGAWDGAARSAEWLRHRKATLIEHARVHAGFETTWRWNCGVDTTNPRSMKHPECAETGILQVSLDSLALEHGGTTLRDCLLRAGIGTGASGTRDSAQFFEAIKDDAGEVRKFLAAMKSDHPLALEYYLRLIRVDTRWAGPINRGETFAAMKPAAIAEWRALLA